MSKNDKYDFSPMAGESPFSGADADEKSHGIAHQEPCQGSVIMVKRNLPLVGQLSTNPAEFTFESLQLRERSEVDSRQNCVNQSYKDYGNTVPESLRVRGGGIGQQSQVQLFNSGGPRADPNSNSKQLTQRFRPDQQQFKEYLTTKKSSAQGKRETPLLISRSQSTLLPSPQIPRKISTALLHLKPQNKATDTSASK